MKHLVTPPIGEVDPYRQYDVIIDGCILWATDTAPAITVVTDSKVLVKSCTFLARPKWWQLWRWWRVIRTLSRPSQMEWWVA